MTRGTAEAVVAILKGIAIAMFFIIGLGGIIISNSMTMFWVSLVVVAACWVAVGFINAYSDKWEEDHEFND
jgi:ABC-type bacteriocin/lantibiotic exporter with double-glycine peptidase domain